MPTKIIVTHLGTLKKKYGTKWKDVDAAVTRLIAADQARGTSTFLVPLDDAKQMGQWKAKAAQSRSFKDAIDHAFLSHNRPDYVVILGGPDVVPHQSLKNPLVGPDADDDPDVPSDLPYACDAAASDDLDDFVGPSRVVGRIPDVQGASPDAAYLVDILDKAAAWKAPKKKGKLPVFGLSAHVWRKSTELSVKAMFGTSAAVRTSPLEGPLWTKNDLSPAWHFINCHGAPEDTHFYGQKGQQYPIAEDSARLGALIGRGTIAAAECCYGAQIYDASIAAGPGICVTYLQEGAIAFLGSTTIAYGPADKNESADLLCRYFMESCLKGASTGRALLEARQRFTEDVAPISPVDLKTIGQFLLLGDPSLRGLALPEPKPKKKGAAKKAALTAPLASLAVTRGALTAKAMVLTEGTDRSASQPSGDTPPDIEQQLANDARAAGYVPLEHAREFAVRRGGNVTARSAMKKKAVQETKFHVLQAAAPTNGAPGGPAPLGAAPHGLHAGSSSKVPKRMLLVGHEVAGKVVRVQRLYAHALDGPRCLTPSRERS